MGKTVFSDSSVLTKIQRELGFKRCKGSPFLGLVQLSSPPTTPEPTPGPTLEPNLPTVTELLEPETTFNPDVGKIQNRVQLKQCSNSI